MSSIQRFLWENSCGIQKIKPLGIVCPHQFSWHCSLLKGTKTNIIRTLSSVSLDRRAGKPLSCQMCFFSIIKIPISPLKIFEIWAIKTLETGEWSLLSIKAFLKELLRRLNKPNSKSKKNRKSCWRQQTWKLFKNIQSKFQMEFSLVSTFTILWCSKS